MCGHMAPRSSQTCCSTSQCGIPQPSAIVPSPEAAQVLPQRLASVRNSTDIRQQVVGQFGRWFTRPEAVLARKQSGFCSSLQPHFGGVRTAAAALSAKNWPGGVPA